MHLMFLVLHNISLLGLIDVTSDIAQRHSLIFLWFIHITGYYLIHRIAVKVFDREARTRRLSFVRRLSTATGLNTL